MIATPPTRDALAKLVKRACQRYAQQRNETRGDTGKLFEERYRSKVIDDESHLMTVTLYNDANAFRARLVADPLAHEWSTGPLHAGRDGSRVGSLWTPSRWYLGLAGTASARARIYADLMIAYTRTPLDNRTSEKDQEAYGRRVERPDGTCAREVALQWR